MKRIQIYSLLFLMIVGISSRVFAQQQVEDVLRGGKDDAQVLAQDYMAPFGKAFGSMLNEGWYNTAKTHGFPFCDLTLYWNWAMVPTADNNFTVPNNLNYLKLQDPSQNTSPTLAGGTNPGPGMNVVVNNPLTGKDTAIANFKMPSGLDLKIVSLPIAQLTVGLIQNTDISFRYMPTFNIPGTINASANLWGVGLKHDLIKDFSGLSLIPIDFSIQGGYTAFKSSLGLSLQPDQNAAQTGADYSNQKLEFDVNSYTINLILSKKLPSVTFYGSVGYEHSSSKFSVLGTFPITGLNSSGQAQIYDIKDPINITLAGVNGMKANVGVRFRIVIFTLHADYTFASYGGFTTGFGVDIDLK
jgi:hypothetical protein